MLQVWRMTHLACAFLLRLQLTRSPILEPCVRPQAPLLPLRPQRGRGSPLIPLCLTQPSHTCRFPAAPVARLLKLHEQ